MNRPACGCDPKNPKPGCPGCEKWANDPQYRALLARFPDPRQGRLRRAFWRAGRLLGRALRFSVAAADHLAHGLPGVSPEEYSRRLTVCNRCEALQRDRSCGYCGCLVAGKAKWARESCPHPDGNKWALPLVEAPATEVKLPAAPAPTPVPQPARKPTCRLVPKVDRVAGWQMPAPAWKRHLLFFVYPVHGNGVWQANVAELLKRIKLFNGSRLCAIAYQDGTVHPPLGKQPHTVDPPELVKEALAGHGFEFFEVPNKPAAGEPVGFKALFERAAKWKARGDVAFYCHAKGVTYFDPEHHVHDWTRLLWSANLDFWPVAEQQFLQGKLITGALRRTSPGGFVHYSGTFFWFRTRQAFARFWDCCPSRWGGVEMWPGRVFKAAETGCIFNDEPPGESAYDPKWLGPVLREFESWSGDRRLAALPSPAVR
jgi:hypothetical protein